VLVAVVTTSSVAVTSSASAVETSVGVSSVSVFDVLSARGRGSHNLTLLDSGLTNLRNITVGVGKMAVAVTIETGRLNIRSLLLDSRGAERRGLVLASEGTVPVIGGNGLAELASKSSISAVSVEAVGVGTLCVVCAEAEGLSSEGTAIENSVATRSDRSGRSLRSNSVSVSKGSVSAVSSSAGLSGTEVISTSTESLAKSKVSGGTLRSIGSLGSTVRSSEGSVVAVRASAVSLGTLGIEAATTNTGSRASGSNGSSGSTVRSSEGSVVGVRAGAVSLGSSSIIAG